MLLSVIVLIGLNKFKINNFLPYLIVGIFLWDFTHQSGIHATIAGIPFSVNNSHNVKITKILIVEIRTWSFTLCGFWNNANICICKCRCFARRFNFCNSFKSVPLGIVLGLFFGKQIGVFVLSNINKTKNCRQT